jgi:glycosyltransferase involved in cell wall biosynthesis
MKGNKYMNTISLCMIVKNEEKTLARCLDSVKGLVDEIIIVDTGSNDKTTDIAMQYTSKVFDYEWHDNFSSARNYAFELGTMDFLMWMDADDVIEDVDKKTFLEYKNTLNCNIDVVMMPYNTAYDKNGTPVFTFYRERIIRRGTGMRWEGAVHECIVPSGNIVRWESAISHHKIGYSDPERNLRIYNKLIKDGKKLNPREQFYYARELMFNGQDRSAAAWFEYYLSDGKGWVENILQACRDLAGCYERLGESEAAFTSLIKSFRYGPPRPELCCELGAFFFKRQDWITASYWYTCALECPKDTIKGGFIQPDCAGYIPLMQLCVCSYKMGNLELAEECNELAGKFKPESPAYLFNKDFFSRKKETHI